jgi:hypothetical protein
MSDAPAARRSDRLWWAAVVLVGLSIVAQGVRALAIGWLPTGDDGYWALMARSVFSAHPPLLGSSSSGGVVTGTGFHHLGPLGFYLLSPFVLVLGGVGAAVGTSVLNALAAVLGPVAVRGSVGERAGWLTVVASALLAFTMGSELLVDPWNPHLSVLALWCALCCTWAVLNGGVWWGAVGVFFASLTLQTHLSFVPVAGIAGLVLLVGTAWGCAHLPVGPEQSRWQRWRALAATLAAGLLANLVVLIQQFFGAGPGNLTNALTSGTGQELPIGLDAGARTVAQAFVPTNWLPGSWFPQVIRPAELASPWVIAAVFVVLVVLEVLAVRRRSTRAAPALTLVLVLVVVAVWVAAGLGFRIFGVPMTLARWAWPVALLTAAVAADAAVGLWWGRVPAAEREDRVGEASPLLRWAGLVVVVVLCVANAVPRDEGSGAKELFRAPITELLDQVGDQVAETGRPYLSVNFQPLAAEATVALMDQLDEQGVEFALDDPVALRQAGTHRTLDGTETATVVLRGGAAVLESTPEGYRTIARVMPLSAADQAWYLQAREGLDERLGAFIDELRADPELRARVGPSEDARLDLEATGWALVLCGRYPELPTGSVDVERSVIDDADRERLCALEDRLANGAVAVEGGAPPPARTRPGRGGA